VIGATGFTNEQRARIRDVAERAPILVAPNMSVGVNALFELVARAVRLLGEGYDCEISEMHHRFKADAPSGTALRLAEVVVESRAKKQLPDVRFGRTGASGPRSAGEIVVHALRGGDVVGEHTVTLAGLGERIELTHRAHTRETFARGALRAARWIYGRPPGLYSMKDVLALDGPPGGAA
jgi:4-hydroxy-tetrahydrodipicolinate reductase